MRDPIWENRKLTPERDRASRHAMRAHPFWLQWVLAMGGALSVAGLFVFYATSVGADHDPLKLHVHEPYLKEDCEACHEGAEGTLLKAPEGGLCLASCHTDFLGEKKFRHGPVNINECLTCHHYHESDHFMLLLVNSDELCMGCHQQLDFSTTSHVEGTLDRTCVECHDPHSSEDPHFLKEGER